jgi:hypothetical protein
MKKLVTKNQIKAVYDYCISQDDFNAKTIDDVLISESPKKQRKSKIPPQPKVKK